MIRKIMYEDAGRRKLAEGIGSLCRILACGGIMVNGAYTRSARTVAGSMEGDDLYVNQGIRLAAGAIGEINSATGCGTEEAAKMILAQLELCSRAVAGGANPVRLSRQIRQAAGEIADCSRKMARPATSADLCGKAAGMAASPVWEGLTAITRDEKLTELIIRGNEAGDIIIKDSMGVKTELELIQGITLKGKLLAGKAGSLADVKVLATKETLSRFSDLLPLLERMDGRPLLIVAEDVEGEALALLNANIEKGRIKVWAVKAPGIGRRREDMLGDLASLTGTHVLDRFSLPSWKNLTPDMLGTAGRLEAADGMTVVEGRGGEDTPARIQAICRKLKEPGVNFFDQQALRERIGWLSGHVPVIYAGGETAVEQKETRLRLEYSAAYIQSVKRWGMLPEGYFERIVAKLRDRESPACRTVLESIRKSLEGDVTGAELFALLVQKVTSLTAMWLTTGAVMVSAGYDREDRELIRNGVDVERLRG